MKTSLRERKKQRTREHIATVAMTLFLERGYDAVKVAEVARAAEVAEKTVYNYFPTKEDLVYDRLEEFEDELLGAIEQRGRDESVVDAFGRFLLSRRGMLGGLEPERLRAISAMIVASPTLLAREHQIFARYTASLATLLAKETAARAQDVRPWVVANALIGVHRALIDYVRAETLAGKPSATVTRGVRARATAALDLLSTGLGDYGRART